MFFDKNLIFEPDMFISWGSRDEIIPIGWLKKSKLSNRAKIGVHIFFLICRHIDENKTKRL